MRFGYDQNGSSSSFQRLVGILHMCTPSTNQRSWVRVFDDRDLDLDLIHSNYVYARDARFPIHVNSQSANISRIDCVSHRVQLLGVFESTRGCWFKVWRPRGPGP
jgi:hypothetical protein